MAVEAKICGVNSAAAMDAAVAGGAAFVGLVFYPPSPRAVSAEEAAQLARRVPAHIAKVGLFVDPSDDEIAARLAACPLDLLQLHGRETPARVAQIRARFGRPVMKAVPVAGPEDVSGADQYARAGDRLLFDAKPPKAMTNALPGGNALSFDWKLLAGRRWPVPWILSGGLDADNVAAAIAASGAAAVDVSSGVEERRGVKSPAKITRFLEVVRAL
jgi:phosphoribosylanthranilate isomerase